VCVHVCPQAKRKHGIVATLLKLRVFEPTAIQVALYARHLSRAYDYEEAVFAPV
jgi:hypothetical protein